MLTEVARQSVLQKKKREHEERTEWVQVEANEEELGSELWPALQWHIALDMLVSALALARWHKELSHSSVLVRLTANPPHSIFFLHPLSAVCAAPPPNRGPAS